MTYVDDDKSVQDSRPRLLYVVTQGTNLVYHFTSGATDINYNGDTYTALPSQDNETGPATTTGETIATLVLPLSHPLCQRFMAGGLPPNKITVTIYRLQLRSNTILQKWFGTIGQMDIIANNLAKFSIPSRFQKLMKKRLPVVTLSQMCPHVLYDVNCTVSRAAHTYTTTVANVNGRVLKLVTIGVFGDNSLALGGEIVHVASGERSTVIVEGAIAFDGTTTFTMQVDIPEIQQGDTVQVVAGCKKDQGTCIGKFDNFANFGGFVDLPPASISSPTGGPNVHYYDVNVINL